MRKLICAAALTAIAAPAFADVDCSTLLSNPVTAKYYDECIARHPPRAKGSGWRDALGGMGAYLSNNARRTQSEPRIYQGEYTGGHNKICRYTDETGSPVAVTVGAADACPR